MKKNKFKKKGSGKLLLITNDIGTKIESLIKEYDLIELEEIKQIIKDKRLILNTKTIRIYLNYKGYIIIYL